MKGQRVDLEALLEEIRARGATGRSITALAGAPGAGKSTTAEALVDRLNAEDPGSAAVLPMDGFHYDDMVLEARGWRPRKGAPHTFDVAGFAHVLRRLRANDEAEVAVPVFDRSIEIARAGARIIPSTVRHVVAEGNYLLLKEPPWDGLATCFDTSVYLEVPWDVLKARLEARWAGLGEAERAAKLEVNDFPNARRVLSESRDADFILTFGE